MKKGFGECANPEANIPVWGGPVPCILHIKALMDGDFISVCYCLREIFIGPYFGTILLSKKNNWNWVWISQPCNSRCCSSQKQFPQVLQILLLPKLKAGRIPRLKLITRTPTQSYVKLSKLDSAWRCGWKRICLGAVREVTNIVIVLSNALNYASLVHLVNTLQERVSGFVCLPPQTRHVQLLHC